MAGEHAGVDLTAIQDLVWRYARAVDERDFDTVRSCFADDLVVDGWGDGSFDDLDGMMRYISGVAVFDFTMHLLLPASIVLDGDRASAVSDAMLTHRLRRPDGSEYTLHLPEVRYVEELARRDGRWVIVRRGGAPHAGPGRTGVRRDIAAAVDAAVPTDPPRILGNQYVTVDGDRATVETYAYVGEPWHDGATVLRHELRRDGPQRSWYCTSSIR